MNLGPLIHKKSKVLVIGKILMAKINQIQGIRAFAIFGIFLSHTKVFLGQELLDSIPTLDYIMSRLGSTGVFCFFILSGFLIGYKGKTIKKTTKLREAICQSYIKIRSLYVLHVFMLIAAFIAKIPQTSTEWVVTAISFPLNITLTHDLIPWVGVIDSFNGPSWFLSAFLIIWFLTYRWPIIVNHIQIANSSVIIKTALIVVLIQYSYLLLVSYIPFETIPHGMAFVMWFTYTNPLLCFSEFLLGICGGAWFRKSASVNNVLLNNLLPFLLIALTVLALKYIQGPVFLPIMEGIIVVVIISALQPYNWGGAISKQSLHGMVWKY